MALLLLLACTVPVPDLARPTSSDPTITDAAAPPPARGPEEEKLYQALYAGEIGEDAYARGQRARLLVWLVALELTEPQLRGLASLSVALRTADAEISAQRAAVGVREGGVFGPVYDALEQRLSQGDALTEAEAQGFAEQLAAARKDAYADEDPRAAHYRRVRDALALVRPWIATLTDEQRTRLGDARFVLGRRLGPFVNPGDYADLVGTMWDGGDFGSLRATARPSEEGHLDIGGLWAVERQQAGPDRRLEGFQVEALVLFTALEPALPDAIALRLGEREVAATTVPAP